MVNKPNVDVQFFKGSISDIDILLRGERTNEPVSAGLRTQDELVPGETGVLVALGESPEDPLRPLALVCHDQDIQGLCGRYAHIRTDFSPLTAWCHLLNLAFHRELEGMMREPRFRGTDAAWCGLVVAETLLLTRRPLASIRISACLASATFAVARTMALWENSTIESIQDRFNFANKLCRGTGSVAKHEVRTSQVRTSFVPMWKCLASLNGGSKDFSWDELHPLVMALNALHRARICREPNEAERFARPLMDTVPEAKSFGRLAEMTPEVRLKLFDELVEEFARTDPRLQTRRNGLALATGYLATVAAGGSPSLSLVGHWADRFPELTGWAYLVGGIGEGVTWTSGFDGLGRLVARELHRPLRLDEPPTCDFGLDEAIVLVDNHLKDPLVHLKIKQTKVLSVSIFPGVNISIPVVDTAATNATGEESSEQTRIAETREQTQAENNVMKTLAETLWPHLRMLVVDETTDRFAPKRRRKSGSQSKAKNETKGAGLLSLPTDRR